MKCYWCLEKLINITDDEYQLSCPNDHCFICIKNKTIDKYKFFLDINDHRYRLTGDSKLNWTKIHVKNGSLKKYYREYHYKTSLHIRVR